MENKIIITIIGEKQARIDYKFLFRGYSGDCKDCKYNKACLDNLEQGRVYCVVKVTKKELPCKLHDGKCRVVEVVEKPKEAIIETRMSIQDALVEFHPIECDLLSCENYEKCVPLGLFKGDRCKILKVIQNIDCPKGLDLILTSLLRQT